MQHLWSFSNTYHNHPKIKKNISLSNEIWFEVWPRNLNSKIFITLLFSCQIKLVYRAKGFFFSLSSSPENQSRLLFVLLDHLHFHASPELEICNSFRANCVSLYASTPRFLHIMISAMLVLETLAFNKLKSTCSIGTSVIEQYSLYFRSCKNTSYMFALFRLIRTRGGCTMDFLYSGSHISGKPWPYQ